MRCGGRGSVLRATGLQGGLRPVGCNGHPAFPTPSLGGRSSNASGALRREGEAISDEQERATLSTVIAGEGGRSSIPRRQ